MAPEGYKTVYSLPRSTRDTPSGWLGGQSSFDSAVGEGYLVTLLLDL